LIQLEGPTDLDLGETHGLKVGISSHRIAGRADAPYVDLVCLDASAKQTFAAVATEIANSVVDTPPDARADAVVAAVREWRWFWDVDPSQMSRTEAIGLFGELWFLNRWAKASPASIRAWEGSARSRHDFQWPTSSVEVKTTSRGGAVVHTIETLEQLDDPESGQLYLFSLRIVRDTLASNSVNNLASAAKNALADDPVGRAELLAKLAQRGYTPAGREETRVTYRVVEEGLYRVAEGFPRLTPRDFPVGLPPGISGLSYRLDISACQQWRLAVSPSDWAP
jgi:hypothetical protein